MSRSAALVAFLSTLALCVPSLKGQGNYEIQVYGSETVAPKSLMFETHSNFTVSGMRFDQNGVYATNHQLHETIEITTGLNDWSEIGFYIFTSEQVGHGTQWVGSHIRPRVRVPSEWHWPVGVSVSTEIGYQRTSYSLDTWTWEIRPIIDKTLGRWYLAANPALERTWHGPGTRGGTGFAPALKVNYDFTKKISAGVEYYANYGRLFDFDPIREQQQQFFAAADLNISPKWEINFGVGYGITASTDHLLVKAIVGRRFSWGKHSPVD